MKNRGRVGKARRADPAGLVREFFCVLRWVDRPLQDVPVGYAGLLEQDLVAWLTFEEYSERNFNLFSVHSACAWHRNVHRWRYRNV